MSGNVKKKCCCDCSCACNTGAVCANCIVGCRPTQFTVTTSGIAALAAACYTDSFCSGAGIECGSGLVFDIEIVGGVFTNGVYVLAQTADPCTYEYVFPGTPTGIIYWDGAGCTGVKLCETDELVIQLSIQPAGVRQLKIFVRSGGDPFCDSCGSPCGEAAILFDDFTTVTTCCADPVSFTNSIGAECDSPCRPLACNGGTCSFIGHSGTATVTVC